MFLFCLHITHGFTASSVEDHLVALAQIYFWNMHHTSSNKRCSNSFGRPTSPELCSCICMMLLAYFCRDIFIMLIMCPFVAGRDEPHWKIKSGYGGFLGKVVNLGWAQAGKMSWQKFVCLGIGCMAGGIGHWAELNAGHKSQRLSLKHHLPTVDSCWSLQEELFLSRESRNVK